ncbi:hypothetical protein LY78DRAFT_660979 [Colletotrichum sublineola]|nr:hypothetical protein LY78DRAFT_660979 [Colletotrichum sublineola]
MSLRRGRLSAVVVVVVVAPWHGLPLVPDRLCLPAWCLGSASLLALCDYLLGLAPLIVSLVHFVLCSVQRDLTDTSRPAPRRPRQLLATWMGHGQDIRVPKERLWDTGAPASQFQYEIDSSPPSQALDHAVSVRKGKEIGLAWQRLGVGHEVWMGRARLRSCGPGLSYERYGISLTRRNEKKQGRKKAA